MITNDIAGLQQLSSEEIDLVSGAGCVGCSGCTPQATCRKTTCYGETVIVDEDEMR